MKNLKLYNLHTNYLNNKAHIQLSNDIYPYASSCLDDMDLHIDKGYEIINYIENPGGAYVNLNIPINNCTTCFEIKFKFNSLTRGLEYVWGNNMSPITNNTHGAQKYAYNHNKYPNGLYSYPRWGSNSANVKLYEPITLIEYTYRYTINTAGTAKFYRNGDNFQTYDKSAYVSTGVNATSTVLFNTSMNSSYASNDFRGRIYYYKRWPSNSSQYDHYLLPIRTTNTVGTKRYGFVDACTGKTYFSSTSVEFTGG